MISGWPKKTLVYLKRKSKEIGTNKSKKADQKVYTQATTFQLYIRLVSKVKKINQLQQ